MVSTDTFFAPSERDPPSIVEGDAERLESAGLIHTILNSFSQIALILNDKRQIVFANDVAVAALPSLFRGLRPGEALGCLHASEGPGGCGTSKACKYCGAVASILECRETDEINTKECRLTLSRGGRLSALDLLVSARRFSTGDREFTLFTFHDMEDSKRRQVLERCFFHDVINSIASIQGGAILLKEEYGERSPWVEAILSSLERLLEEVLSQRDFLAMERGDLSVNLKRFSNWELMGEVVAAFSASDFSRGKSLFFDTNASAEVPVHSDPILLRRVLINMVKNALEASVRGDQIRVWTSGQGPGVRFCVWNPAVMDEAVRLQVFQRSFSTKGPGRGIGTYSIRMLTKDYLKGEVGFSSLPEEGTIFWVEVPAAGEELQ